MDPLNPAMTDNLWLPQLSLLGKVSRKTATVGTLCATKIKRSNFSKSQSGGDVAVTGVQLPT
jgi:hypothetical protein